MNLNATILGQTISFIIFVWFFMKYIWIPLISIIENRRKKISDSLEQIKQSKIKSAKLNKEALIFLKKAHIEAQKIVKQAQDHKIKILNEAKIDANQERNVILSQAKYQIDQEKKRVYEELRKKIGQLTILSTEKIIEKSINNIIDCDLIDNIIKTIPDKIK